MTIVSDPSADPRQKTEKQPPARTARKKADLTVQIGTKTGAGINIIKPEGRIKRVGYQVECTDCGWTSFRYEQRTTTELIRATHMERCNSVR